MRIEEHWNDGFLYYIEFLVKQDNLLKVIRKHIVVYEEMENCEIIKIVEKRFKDVIHVKFVEFYEDVLLIKIWIHREVIDGKIEYLIIAILPNEVKNRVFRWMCCISNFVYFERGYEVVIILEASALV